MWKPCNKKKQEREVKLSLAFLEDKWKIYKKMELSRKIVLVRILEAVESQGGFAGMVGETDAPKWSSGDVVWLDIGGV